MENILLEVCKSEIHRLTEERINLISKLVELENENKKLKEKIGDDDDTNK